MKLTDLEKSLTQLIPQDSRPVVVFSAIWPILHALEDIPQQQVPLQLIELMKQITGSKRSLIMPSFTHGYRDGVCNLDQESSSTGVLSELFRKQNQVLRSMSAFFSYATLGPDAQELNQLRPEHAWGDGSIYDWMEQKNAHFIMLGAHLTHCSYLHRMEWLAKEVINYRYVKRFEGVIHYQGKDTPMIENLYVRSLNPSMINDFTQIQDVLLKGGMTHYLVEGISLAHMNAQDMKNAYLTALLNDPWITVQNRHDFEGKELTVS